MKLSDLRSLHSASTSRTYPVEAEELARTIEEAVRRLPRWSLASSTEAEIRAVCKTRVFGFKDDVTVCLTPALPART